MMHCPSNFPFNVICLDETHSTNSYLSELCSTQAVDDLTTIVAEFQTAGRGQRGNTWESEAESNLLFSFVLHPTFLLAKQQFFISQVVALSIQEVLSNYADGFSIKWPNDIYWHNKKVAGILIENDLAGQTISRTIAGIGLNINQRQFVSDAPNPVSLYQIIGQDTDRFEVLSQILHQVNHYYQLLKNGDAQTIADRYMKALFRKSGYHLYRDANGTFSAQIIDIESNGRLLLKDDLGTERGYFFKEVESLI